MKITHFRSAFFLTISKNRHIFTSTKFTSKIILFVITLINFNSNFVTAVAI
jgi:hypothetical protein